MERKNIDPELAMIRAAARTIDDGRARNDLEGARFNLYSSVEAADQGRAVRWLETCRVCAEALEPATRGRVNAALDRIATEVAS